MYSLLAPVVALAISLMLEPHIVTVNITVTDSAGTPVPQVPLMIRDIRPDVYGVTDEKGVLSVVKELSPLQTWLAVCPKVEPMRVSETPEQASERARAHGKVFETHAFKRFYRLDLAENETNYRVAIQTGASRGVSARAMRVDVPAHGVLMEDANSGSMARAKKYDGRIRVRGVATGPSRVYITSAARTRVLDVPSGSGDFDLGDVQVLVDDGNCSVAITATNLDRLDKTYFKIEECVTLVSADGRSVYSLATSRSETDTTRATTASTPAQTIPAGTWYVVPLYFSNTPAQKKVIDRLIAGQSVTGVPSVTATAYGHVSLDFDAEVAERAIAELQ